GRRRAARRRAGGGPGASGARRGPQPRRADGRARGGDRRGVGGRAAAGGRGNVLSSERMSTQTDHTNLYAMYASFKAARGRRRVDPAQASQLAADAEAALTGGAAVLRASYSTVGFRA